MSERQTMGRKRPEAPYQTAAPSAIDPDLDDPVVETPWRYDMDAAPRDGSEIALLLSHGAVDYKLVTWRKSRRMVAYKWMEQEGWSDRMTRQMYYDIEPVAWARHDVVDGLRKG